MKMIKTSDLKVGYGKKVVISDINIEVNPGSIVTLIGPNGSGKSTILKTIVSELKCMSGNVFVMGDDLNVLKEADVSKRISMVMTEKIKTELMTSRDVVATARYPYTGRMGLLQDIDRQKIDEALALTGATEIADLDFSTLSDGQKQRVMFARAICQDTEIIVLDEPTSFLDMKYKLELMKLTRILAYEQNKAILMSLHELDLARAISDICICVDGERIVKCGTVDEIYSGNFLQKLFGVADDEFDPATGCMHLI